MDQTIINANKYHDNREEAITSKIEQCTWINKHQIEVKSFYFTTNGGLIAWVQLDPRLVSEIHRRAGRAASKSFRTATYVPKMARARKTGVDQLLMEFKKSNPDFRYLIRNGKDDITVLMKRMSEGLHMPYRKFDIENLGAISPLKTRTAAKENGDEEIMRKRESEDGFSLPRST